ncbi:aspartate--tRNA ligase [Clostridia bacterium]|nr:aspartate--tRNA ligase [Clostridia bacterium]
MSETSKTSKLFRDCYCGEVELPAGFTEKQISVCGFAATVRDKGGVVFIDLRDRTGVVQLVFDDTTDPAVFSVAKSVKTEYVLSVSGILRYRAVVNPNIASGKLEIFVTRLDILSVAERPPFEIGGEAVKEDIKTGEDVRLRYRYLDLRRNALTRNIILRHEIARVAREYFYSNGFLEIETPVMMKSTPEGARDYLVPSRVHQGRFYALPQSPQIYKQLLMVAGYDRYIQLARCFRDEDLRADRQPEFTQIDLEMSFVDTDDIIAMLESFFVKLMGELKGVTLTLPLPRITYDEAMRRYGSDKPDTRYALELTDVTSAVSGIDCPVFKPRGTGEYTVNALVVPDSASVLTRKEIDRHIEFIKGIGGSGAAFIRFSDDKPASSFNKFVSEEQLLQLCADIGLCKGGVAFIGVNEGVVDGKGGKYLPLLGALRTRIAEQLGLIPADKFNFVWVTEFPFFEYDSDSGKWNAMHHPFTMPLDENLKYLGLRSLGDNTDNSNTTTGDTGVDDVQYAKIYAKAYDLVLNGTELLSGSIRITDASLQRRMFTILGLTEDEIAAKFGFLVTAYSYGSPPHGGAGIGLDRLAMVLSGASSLRDVIAFPKIKDGSEPMSGSPGEVDTAQLDDLGLRIR